MTELPNAIFQKWLHSFEEDMGGLVTYRPAEYNFPLARGRAGIEFRPDGTFIEWQVGRADARQGISGRWQIDNSGRIRISFDENVRPPLILEIVQCDAGMLRVRQSPGSF